MARLNNTILCDSDDEDFPDLSTILQRPIEVCAGREKSQGKGGKEENEKEAGREIVQHGIVGSIKSAIKNSCDEKQLRKQRPLGLAHVNSLLLPFAKEPAQKKTNQDQSLDSKKVEMKRLSPRRAAKARVDYRTHSSSTTNTAYSDNDVSFDDLSGFIVEDSASDVEEPTPRTRNLGREVVPSGEKFMSKLKPNIIDLTSPKKASKSDFVLASTLPSRSPKKPSIPDSKSPEKSSKKSTPSVNFSNTNVTNKKSQIWGNIFDEDPGACLRFSPPGSRSVHKSSDKNGLATPPSSPSKPGLNSPSKRIRIPQSPHRPSVDAFWSQEVINDWNDQYSPRKTPQTERTRKIIFISDEDESEPSPSASPRRSPIKSPVKKGRQEIQLRKIFDEKKHSLATTFLRDVDEKTTNGKIAELAASAGGIQIVWSKKLRSTAGRANWRRETLRTKNPDGTVMTTYRHHAKIELAEKIIDDEDRLFNTIAHEYCHLANFMISGVKDNPHGKEFKEWAHKVTGSFSHLGIHVTTKHSYAISYKYVWTCTNRDCGLEYKRHSRSIDPTRHRCGKCRSSLVQIKPIPRAGAVKIAGTGSGDGTISKKEEATGTDPKGRGGGRYQEYVRKHFGRVRNENPALGMAGWMVELGRGFREERARGVAEEMRERERESVSGLGPGAAGMAMNETKGKDDKAEEAHTNTMDSVARKLDFLSLF